MEKKGEKEAAFIQLLHDYRTTIYTVWKQQFAILTDKLEAQEINNERLFRTVMKTKMKSINTYYYWVLFLGLPVIVFSLFTTKDRYLYSFMYLPC